MALLCGEERLTYAELAAFGAAARALEPGFADLVTDLEAFSGDPIL